jgi:hypothetical protein
MRETKGNAECINGMIEDDSAACFAGQLSRVEAMPEVCHGTAVTNGTKVVLVRWNEGGGVDYPFMVRQAHHDRLRANGGGKKRPD